MKNFGFMILLLSISSFTYCQSYISGPLSGELDSSDSPYYVIDTIYVPAGDSLEIMPAVTIIFTGRFPLIVDTNAVLKAIGNETDSIVFTAQNHDLGYSGIRFLNSADGCTLSYCKMEYGIARNGWDENNPVNYGGAIYCQSSEVTILNSSIRNNGARFKGGAIYAENSKIIVENSEISHNSSREGGAIYLYNNEQTAIFSRNRIDNDSTLDNKGTICIDNSAAIFSNNIITGNSAINIMRMLYCRNSSPILINNTIVANNGITSETHPVTFYFIGNSNPILINDIFWDSGGKDEIHLDLSDGDKLWIYNSLINYESLINLGDLNSIYYDRSNFYTNPEFADSSFRLDYSSYCINTGVQFKYLPVLDTVVFAPNVDIYGNSRPSGGGYDIGAVESPFSSVNRRPILYPCVPIRYMTTGKNYEFPIRAFDPDYDALTYSYSMPSFFTVEGDSEILCSPHLSDTGNYDLSISVCDSEYCDTCSFVVVIEPAEPPLFTHCNYRTTMRANTTQLIRFEIDDTDRFDLTYSVEGADFAEIDGDSRTISISPTAADTGVYNISGMVCNEVGCDTCVLHITIIPDSVYLTSCPENDTVYPGGYLIFSYSATDVAENPVNYSLFRNHDTLFVDTTATRYYWYISPSDRGINEFHLTACVGELCDTCDFTITVLNNPPKIIDTLTDTIKIERHKINSVYFDISDKDTDEISFNVISAPEPAELFWSDTTFRLGYNSSVGFDFIPISDSGIYNFSFEYCDIETCDTYSFAVKIIPRTSMNINCVSTKVLPEKIQEIDTLAMWDRQFIVVKGKENTYILNPSGLSVHNTLDFVNWLALADVDSDYSVDWLTAAADSVKLHISGGEDRSAEIPNISYAKIMTNAANDFKIILGKKWSGEFVDIPCLCEGSGDPNCDLSINFFGEDYSIISSTYDNNLSELSVNTMRAFPLKSSANYFVGKIYGYSHCSSFEGTYCQSIVCDLGNIMNYFEFYRYDDEIEDYQLIATHSRTIGSRWWIYRTLTCYLNCSYAVLGHTFDDKFYLVVQDYPHNFFIFGQDGDSCSITMPDSFSSSNFITTPFMPSFIVQSNDTLMFFAEIDSNIQQIATGFIPSNETLAQCIVVDDTAYILTYNQNILKKYKIIPTVKTVWNIHSGWNLLFYPFADTVAVSDIFPDAILPAFAFDYETRGYMPTDTLHFGMSFWLAYPSDTTIERDEYPQESISYRLYPGWNLIGSPSEILQENSITSNPNIFDSVIEYSSQTQSYKTGNQIVPGYAYWIFVIDTTEIEIR